MPSEVSSTRTPSCTVQAETRGVFGGIGNEEHVTLAAGADQIHHAHEHHGGFCKLTRPRQHLVPFRVHTDAPDGLLMEAGERIACVFAEKEADPFNRVLLQPGELPAPFRVRQAVDGHVALGASCGTRSIPCMPSGRLPCPFHAVFYIGVKIIADFLGAFKVYAPDVVEESA